MEEGNHKALMGLAADRITARGFKPFAPSPVPHILIEYLLLVDARGSMDVADTIIIIALIQCWHRNFSKYETCILINIKYMYSSDFFALRFNFTMKCAEYKNSSVWIFITSWPATTAFKSVAWVCISWHAASLAWDRGTLGTKHAIADFV